MGEKGKKYKVPHTFVIIFIIILAAVALTWIIPAGMYDFVKTASGRKVVDPSTFRYVTSAPVNPLRIPMFIVEAFAKRIDLMLVILFAGSAFHVVTKTGSLQAILAIGAKKFSDKLYIFIPVLTLLFALICTTQGVNTFIPFAPIMVMLSLAMGLDSISGVSIILLGGAIGFSTGTLNVSTTVVAQTIAELPIYSGIGYRWVCFAVYYVVTNILLIKYAMKIKKNPMASPMYDLDQAAKAAGGEIDLDSFGTMTLRKAIPLVLLVIAMIMITYGSIMLKWEMREMSATFLAFSIIADLLSGATPSETSKDILEGSKKMLGAAFIIGMATSISSIMNAGKIIYTVVHALSLLLEGLPPIVVAPAMVIANTIINVFITSGSGQAVAVMPIMIPLSDVLGVTRQTAILAFNFGDGFCNYILPTSTALMGNLSVTNITYDRWMRFMWKIFLVWLVVGCVLVTIAQAIHYGPM